MDKWYKRLADVPRVGYPGSPGIDRTQLPGYNTAPKVEVYTHDGKRQESLWWSNGTMSGTMSPAQRRGATSAPGAEPPQIALRRMYEALELPGALSDYHFAIQNCCGQLSDWKTRHKEPWVFAEIEKLCWLDIRLVEAYPEMVASNREERPAYYMISAFNTLIRFYEQEGYLYEALDVAERAARFGNIGNSLEQLRVRVANLEAESAG